MRQLHRAEMRPCDYGEPQRIRHAFPIRPAGLGEREHRLEQRLELERRPYLADEAHLVVAGVPETMWRARFDNGDLAAAEHELFLAALEAERSLDHGEALALGGMDMCGGDEAVRLNRALDHDGLAVRVGRRGVEGDAFPGDGVVDRVSGADHLEPPSLCRLTPRRLGPHERKFV